MKLVKQAFRTHPGGSRPLLSPAQSCAHPCHPWAGRQPFWQGPSASSPPGRARPPERLRNPARLVGSGACSPEGSRRRDAAQIWDHHSSSDQPVPSLGTTLGWRQAPLAHRCPETGPRGDRKAQPLHLNSGLLWRAVPASELPGDGAAAVVTPSGSIPPSAWSCFAHTLAGG